MTEEEKRKFDAWESLRDHAWREFVEKSSIEWRLNFGIWAALLASAGTLLAAQKKIPGLLLLLVAPMVIVLVLIGHAAFLIWVQTRLQEARGDLDEAQDQMRKLINAPDKQRAKRSVWKQAPMYVGLAITVLLLGVFLIVLKWL